MSKRQRTVRQDRVTLDVGGEIFVTNRSTLAGSSSYFQRMWSDDSSWQEATPDGDDVIPLDRDSDSFRVLLSVMRAGPGRAVKLLPADNLVLCRRVLYDAEYFGVDGLLGEVKVAAQQHLHLEEAKHTITAFDEEHGTLDQAIDSGVLPERCFGPPPCAYPRIKQLVAASKKSDVCFTDGNSEGTFRRQIACYALVEQSADGTTTVEPVIARRPEELPLGAVWTEGGDTFQGREMLLPFSEWKRQIEADDNHFEFTAAVRPFGEHASDEVGDE